MTVTEPHIAAGVLVLVPQEDPACPFRADELHLVTGGNGVDLAAIPRGRIGLEYAIVDGLLIFADTQNPLAGILDGRILSREFEAESLLLRGSGRCPGRALDRIQEQVVHAVAVAINIFRKACWSIFQVVRWASKERI